MKLPKELLTKLSSNLLHLRKQVQGRIMSLKLQDPFSNPDRLNDNAASDTEANEESSHERMEALEKELTCIPGIVEVGIFTRRADRYYKASSKGLFNIIAFRKDGQYVISP